MKTWQNFKNSHSLVVQCKTALNVCIYGKEALESLT